MTPSATAFAPAHITGFFEICDSNPDPLKKGSRGAGISIKLGVSTRVKTSEASKNRFAVRINGFEGKTPVSNYVLNTFSSLTDTKYEAQVDHMVRVPVGSGFGSSGAGALSLALALNKSLEAGFSDFKAAQIAHLAELECQTGLGTVIAEMHGGFEMRLEPGAPGVGEIKSVPLSDGWKVVCLCFNPISKRVLKEPSFRRKVNRAGREALREFLVDPTPSCFMDLSRGFSEKLGLISNEVRKVLVEADKESITCSMMMIGESVFSLVDDEKEDELVRIFERHSRSKGDVFVADVDFEGARLLS